MEDFIIVGEDGSVTAVAEGIDIYEYALQIGGTVIKRSDYIPPIPSLSYKEALLVLNTEYQTDVDAFNKVFYTAYLADGPSQDVKQQTIRQQYYLRKTKYSSDYTALKNQYGV